MSFYSIRAIYLFEMARTRRTELLLSPEGNFMVLVDKISPRLVDWILSHVLKRRKSGRA